MTIRSLKYLFQPRSAVVIGAVDDPCDAGGVAARNLLGAGFSGEVFFVNPQGGAFNGCAVSTRVAELPLAPELAIVARPEPSGSAPTPLLPAPT